MPIVWVPPLMRDLTGGVPWVEVSGRSVREVVDELERRYPGVRARLCEGERLAPGLAVAVDGRMSRLGMFAPVEERSEVRFLPAIEGG